MNTQSLLTKTQKTTKPSFTPVSTMLLQRKCACGNSSGLTGKCSECQKKRLTLQRRAVNNPAESSEVPPIVHEVLHSPGQPLNRDTRTLAEQDLDYNFSKLKVSGENHPPASVTTTIVTNTEPKDENLTFTITPRLSSGRFTNIPTGTLPATFGSGIFGASFSMNSQVRGQGGLPGACVDGECGEYRQFVRGFFRVNGRDVVHRLCSNTLNSTTFHEDCVTIGGTNFKYGYHSIPFDTSQFTNPDQTTGCTFNGFDHPGFNLSSLNSGDRLEINLEFQGKVVDTCTFGHFTFDFASWKVEGSGTVP